MSRSRWRALAGLLCLSLGGIVVCAEEQNAKPAVTKPRPVLAVVPPVVVDVAVAAPVIEPAPAPAPVVAVVPTPEPAPAPEPEPQIVRPIDHEPAVRELPPTPVAPTPEPAPVAPVALPVPISSTVVVEPDPAPVAPTPITLVATPVSVSTPPAAPRVAVTPTATSFPWRLKIEMVGGLTQLDICRGDELQLRVQCEKLDLQTPAGGLQASGKVRVSGPCVEACGDRLTIVWGSGHIAMEGHVRLICQNGQTKTELGAESIVFRLIGGGAGIELNARDVSSQIPVK